MQERLTGQRDVKAVTAEPDNLSLNPKTHVLFSDLPRRAVDQTHVFLNDSEEPNLVDLRWSPDGLTGLS